MSTGCNAVLILFHPRRSEIPSELLPAEHNWNNWYGQFFAANNLNKIHAAAQKYYLSVPEEKYWVVG